MKILYKNKTKYSKNIYNDFLEFHLKTFKLKYFAFSISIIFILFILMSITAKYNYFNISLVIAISIIVFFIYRYIKPQKEVENTMKSDIITDEKIIDYTFFEDMIKISLDNQYAFIKYKELYGVYYTNDYCYFYIDNSHAYMLNNHNFYYGDFKDFKMFLKSKCKFKCKFKDFSI